LPLGGDIDDATPVAAAVRGEHWTEETGLVFKEVSS
jgi:hypothetical protein